MKWESWPAAVMFISVVWSATASLAQDDANRPNQFQLGQDAPASNQESGYPLTTLDDDGESELPGTPDNEAVEDNHENEFDLSYELPTTLFEWSSGFDQKNGDDDDGGFEPVSPLVTDRPDFTEASSTVGLGVSQLEIGYTYGFDNDGTQTVTHSFPEPLFRFGFMAEWLEGRIGWNYFSQSANGVSTSGSDDLYLGLKIALTPQECLLPEMALIPQMNVPTGSAPFTAGEVLAGLNWVYSWEINDCISTGGSTQFNRAVEGVTGHAYTEWAQSWTIAYTLTPCVGAYTEYFGFYPHSALTADPEHYFNGGFTYLVNCDVQLDIRGGLGLNAAAEDYFVGTGISVRYR